MAVGLSPIAVPETSDFVPVFRKEFLDIQATIECEFTLKCVCDMIRICNHFFHLYQQNKSSEPKVKFRQIANCCKRVLETAKLTYATKQKNPSLPRNLVLGTFGELLIVFSIKVNLLSLLYSMAQRCCHLLLIKQSCLLKAFL